MIEQAEHYTSYPNDLGSPDQRVCPGNLLPTHSFIIKWAVVAFWMPVARTKELLTPATEPGQTNSLAAHVATVNEQHRRQWLNHNGHWHRISMFPLFGSLYGNNLAGPGQELSCRWLWWWVWRLWFWYLSGWWWWCGWRRRRRCGGGWLQDLGLVLVEITTLLGHLIRHG